MTVSTTDTTVLNGGVSWVGLQTTAHRTDFANFSPGTSFWYSSCISGGNYVSDVHYAIYLRGNLVTASGGVPPSCRPLPTCTPTPHGGVMMGVRREGTPTLTPTATPTAYNGLIQSALAEPNVSRNGEPIKFVWNLAGLAKVNLMIFSLTGEVIYQENLEGNSGTNNLIWPLENQLHKSVASGLYIYLIQASGGTNSAAQTGKIVVLH
jgi:hypothetical protein